MDATKPPKPLKKSILKPADVSALAQTIHNLYVYFCGMNQDKKVTAWLTTPNPHFGGAVPINMFLIGRGKKALKTIEAMLEREWP